MDPTDYINNNDIVLGNRRKMLDEGTHIKVKFPKESEVRMRFIHSQVAQWKCTIFSLLRIIMVFRNFTMQ